MNITIESLGDAQFKKDYKTRYAYIAGSMYKGIASPKMVVRMGKAGYVGFFGTGGLKLSTIEEGIQYIQSNLKKEDPYGLNLLNNLDQPQLEEKTVDLFLKYNINYVEAAAYIQLTPSLVRYRLKGLHKDTQGNIVIPNYILAKISRPEVAEAFLSPPPKKIVEDLLAKGLITAEEASLSTTIPMSHDICVESDSGGHTDRRIALTLLPTIIRQRNEFMQKYQYKKQIRVGAAGGIGTPEAAAACFILGADFILTGSINQCTVEAGTSDQVKDVLQQMNVQDTAYAPAGDMFELGAQVQVARKGLLFPGRANKLYDLYTHLNSLDELTPELKNQIETRYFCRSFEEVWEETRNYYLSVRPDEIKKAESNPKHKMALIFKWYFIHTNRLALKGDKQQQVDYQIHCSSALGAFNQWVKGTELENWRNRHVDVIAEKIMTGTAVCLDECYEKFSR